MSKKNKQSRSDYIFRAFAAGCYGGFAKSDLEAYERRWGQLTFETFERVLQSNVTDDRVIAIFAIGYANTSKTDNLLVPLLRSGTRRERWASAIVLGEQRKEQSLSILYQCLQEARSAPNENEAFSDENIWLDSSRKVMASLLGDWGQPSSIPVLRSSLKDTWVWEQSFLAILPKDSELEMLLPWEECQFELAYALGQLGAFGALTGITFSSARERVLLVHMAAGALQLRQKVDDFLIAIMGDKEVQKDIAHVLEERFGFTEEEQSMCIQRFFRDYFREDERESKKSDVSDNEMREFGDLDE